jgi:hypothetical protein
MSSSDEAEFDEEDDVPLASLKENEDDGEGRSPPRKRKAVDYTDGGDDDVEEEEQEEEEEGDDDDDDDDDSDDEDDVPLASLKKSPSKAKAKPKAKTPASKKKAKPAPKSPTKSSSTSGGSKTYDSASAALYESDSKKGMLIQKILCRWWYAVTWPDPATLPEEPPKHYDDLDGFPGVYICTSGDKVGHILDMRDAEQCPSFQNYAKKSSKELKELLLKALEEQMRQLIEHEGEGTPTEKQIKEDIKLVKRIKVDESDKEAVKVLKASKMKI